ncbi:hypothetical protein CEXT_342121 [Caerostris extrusa]|uniref:Uncharacterized protein n=1 Tax=Caerostris extrusa TaxID=172846 RepID=A0AAV4TK78_CAEEX|nr:hypothetical protein CEXT_342121 [Caerostris extrusa]
MYCNLFFKATVPQKPSYLFSISGQEKPQGTLTADPPPEIFHQRECLIDKSLPRFNLTLSDFEGISPTEESLVEGQVSN